MKKILITIVTLFVMASPAYADPLAIGDSRYVGSVTDGIPSNPADEATYINALHVMAVGTSGTCAGSEYCVRSNLVAPAGGFDDAVVAGNVKVDISGEYTGATINTAGYTWILAKYNAKSAGSLVWYLDGSVSSVTLPLLFNGKGLSHYTLFNPGPGCCQQVPEPGTLGLLGIGLLGLGFARRRKTA